RPERTQAVARELRHPRFHGHQPGHPERPRGLLPHAGGAPAAIRAPFQDRLRDAADQRRAVGPDLAVSHRRPPARRPRPGTGRLRLAAGAGQRHLRRQRGYAMSDDLLPWYDRELSSVRRQAAQFAEAHPKIASRLRLGPDSAEDPHVERLIEAFAYLTARVRRKLDDDFPEITEALLGVLYPHYQRPFPSMAIVQLEFDPEQKELPAGHTVPRHSPVETEPIQGEPCRFRTGYPVTLWPIEVRAASLSRPPFQ